MHLCLCGTVECTAREGGGMWRQDEEGSVCIRTDLEQWAAQMPLSQETLLFETCAFNSDFWGVWGPRMQENWVCCRPVRVWYKFYVVFASIHPINIPYIVMFELTITSQGKHSWCTVPFLLRSRLTEAISGLLWPPVFRDGEKRLLLSIFTWFLMFLTLVCLALWKLNESYCYGRKNGILCVHLF